MALKGTLKKDWKKGVLVCLLTIIGIIGIGFAINYFNGGF
jgi:hypothetical protein